MLKKLFKGEGMKKYYFLLLFNFIAILAFGEIRNSWTFQKFVNAQSGLRLRETPSIDGRILTTIPYNGMVIISWESRDQIVIGSTLGKWVKVYYKDFNGWVFDGYLSDRNSAGEIPYIAQTALFENIRREFILDNRIPDFQNNSHIVIDSNSNSIETFRGLKIGDSIETLLRIYPEVRRIEAREGGGPWGRITVFYQFSLRFFYNDWILGAFALNFYIDGGKIIRIESRFSGIDYTAHGP